jgi:predicted porin
MKKILFATTALVAAGMIVAPAQAAEKIKLGMSGYFYAWGVFVSEDDGLGLDGLDATADDEPGNNRRSHRFVQESEVIFSGSTKLDNGVQIGVNIQLEGESQGGGDQIDESYIFFSGNFGRIEIGARDDAAFRMNAFIPNSSTGSGHNFANIVGPRRGGNAVGSVNTYSTFTGDNEKVTYFTPRVSGFQLGISYTPTLCENDAVTFGAATLCSRGAGNPTNNNAGRQAEALSLGINFREKLGDANVHFSAGWAKGDLEAQNAAGTAEDRDDWNVGAVVSFGAFRVGVQYQDTDLGTSLANSSLTDWAVSGSYKMGSLTYGLIYAQAEAEAGAAGGSDELAVYAAGITYAMGPGVILIGDLSRHQWDDNLNVAQNENTGTTFTVGTKFSF